MTATPLWKAACNGHSEVVEVLACGRDLDLNRRGFHFDGNEYFPLELARKRNKTEVVSPLERYLANPAQTRHELRVKLGLLDELAAELFALTVFLCRFSVAHGAANGALLSCVWLNEAVYSSQRFRRGFQISCTDSSLPISLPPQR